MTRYALRLAHRLAMTEPERSRAANKEELRQLAHKALAQANGWEARVAELERRLKNSGPKFQGMTELA
jgi:hypothetical protein